MEELDTLRIETVCASGREELPSVSRPLIAPIYQASVWALDSVEECQAIYSGEQPGYIYTRDGNPNHRGLERVVAQLERAEEAVAFGTGMGAVAAAVTALAKAGSRIVAASQLYGATTSLLGSELSRFDVELVEADVTDLTAIEEALSPAAAVLLVETVANPLLQVADLPALAALCRKYGARFVVDNTFPSPTGCRPLQHGADITLHSVTKFLGGHSDLTLGVATGSAELMQALRRQARLWGGAANPFESWLALRGIATLPLRMERSGTNAAELARRLEEHPAVRRVHYPGLRSHPQYEVAARVLDSPGAMLSFEAADGPAAENVLRRLRHVRFAPSLGDVATTASYPTATSHRHFSQAERDALGITPGLIRLSVGIDHVDDVWADLDQALRGA